MNIRTVSMKYMAHDNWEIDYVQFGMNFISSYFDDLSYSYILIFEITDEDKFTLCMLKYPELIIKIV